MKKRLIAVIGLILILAAAGPAAGRTKLSALPERGRTIIRLDHPRSALIEEQRVLTLSQGVNRVDFSWKGVNVDPDSIRLTPLSHPEKVTLLNVSYPPNEAALVWEVHSEGAFEEQVRISYLLAGVDRLVEYRLIADQEEKTAQFVGYVVLRNFSGEDFERAEFRLGYDQGLEDGIRHQATKKVRYLDLGRVPMEKVWTFDAAKLPWDPERVQGNVGIPFGYRLENTEEAGLGRFPLQAGKVRIFQRDGRGGTIILGEDRLPLVPVGEELEATIGESRDIVVTQQRMRQNRINVRRDDKNRIVLHDVDEVVVAEIENFKDQAATLTMIQHIKGDWKMLECNREYEKKDAGTLEFRIKLPPKSKKRLRMHYIRRNIRSN
jgi:hypothetical protein